MIGNYSEKERDMFQIAAFKAFYRAAIIGGLDLQNAFVSAIVKSSDEATEKVLIEVPNAIEIWKHQIKKIKGKRKESYETEQSENPIIQGDQVL